LRRARALLVRRDVGPAMEELDALVRSSPKSMVARIFRGAALERDDRSERGMAEYETFVLSCGAHPLAAPLVGVLRDYLERIAPEGEARAPRPAHKTKVSRATARRQRLMLRRALASVAR
jgi:hypothetical protein